MALPSRSQLSVHIHTCVPTGTLHAVKQGATPSTVCLLLQMSHTGAQPLTEPAYPWGSSPGRLHLKTEQGEQESICAMHGRGGGSILVEMAKPGALAPPWREGQEARSGDI